MPVGAIWTTKVITPRSFRDVENWLVARTRAQDTTHFFHAPSLPFAYSSGKLGDWYPDLVDARTGRLVIYEEKPGWQRGWFAQHQRLIEALASQTTRAPLIVQGDFHATAVGKMVRSGELSLAQPVNVVLAGTLGTGPCFSVLVPQDRFEAIAIGGDGRSTQGDGEERLLPHRRDAR